MKTDGTKLIFGYVIQFSILYKMVKKNLKKDAEFGVFQASHWYRYGSLYHENNAIMHQILKDFSLLSKQSVFQLEYISEYSFPLSQTRSDTPRNMLARHITFSQVYVSFLTYDDVKHLNYFVHDF